MLSKLTLLFNFIIEKKSADLATDSSFAFENIEITAFNRIKLEEED